MADKELISTISNIMYDNFVGESDPELPKDEYIAEARELISQLEALDKEPSQKDINVRLTQIMAKNFGYEFTEWELSNGAFDVTPAAIREVFMRSRHQGN